MTADTAPALRTVTRATRKGPHNRKRKAIAFPLAFFGQFDLVALSRFEGFDPMLPNEGRLLAPRSRHPYHGIL